MSSVIAVGPGGKAQAPERDDRFGRVIDLVLERGLLDKPLLTPPCRDYEHADDTRRAILRSARYYCSCGRKTCTHKYKNYPTESRPRGGCPDSGQRVSGRADIVKDSEGRLRVQVTFHDKAEAMRAVIQKYGPDPSKWPYNSRAKRLKED